MSGLTVLFTIFAMWFILQIFIDLNEDEAFQVLSLIIIIPSYIILSLIFHKWILSNIILYTIIAGIICTLYKQSLVKQTKEILMCLHDKSLIRENYNDHEIRWYKSNPITKQHRCLYISEQFNETNMTKYFKIDKSLNVQFKYDDFGYTCVGIFLVWPLIVIWYIAGMIRNHLRKNVFKIEQDIKNRINLFENDGE